MKRRAESSQAVALLHQEIQFTVELLQLIDQLFVPDIVLRGSLSLDMERSARLQNAPVYFIKRIESLPVQRGHQFRMGEQLGGQRLLPDVTVFYQHARLS